MYAGDTWVVEAGNSRKEQILARRFVVYDATLESGDVLAEEPAFKKYLGGGFPGGKKEVVKV